MSKRSRSRKTLATPPTSIEKLVRRATGAIKAERESVIQSLWSGYGEIVRLSLEGSDMSSVIVKSVSPPTSAKHPRGWSTNRSHDRKLRSYAVEMKFYEDFSERCDTACRVPHCLASHSNDGKWTFVLEDLDAAGFPERRQDLSASEVGDCLTWLANFHGRFMGVAPDGLWKTGTYWHLATRPDELAAMGDTTLRQAAGKLDARLNACAHKTLVHGDAKVANFCFARADSDATSPVAAVDFQYVGGGCGMKDVAYFFSSIWDSADCAAYADDALAFYFTELAQVLRPGLKRQSHQGESYTAAAVEREWRELYPLAWADFYRFLDGWAPGHHKIHGYSKRMTKTALESLR